MSIDETPVRAPPVVKFNPVEEIERASRAEPIVTVSTVVLSVPMLIEFPAEPVPTLIVLELFPLPIFTVPVVPESRVTEPVEPEVIETFPVVAVRSVIPFVPEFSARPVAPVEFPTVIALAAESVPRLIAPVPVFRLNVPFVVV